jgi:hypothetical protein
MMSLSSLIDGRSSRGRSAISNDVLKLRGVDGRSASGRRFRDLMRSFAAEIGDGIESLSEQQRAICGQAAMATIQIETLQSRVVSGDAVDPELIIRTGNVQLRALAALGLRKGSKPADGASALQSYLQSIAQRDAEPEETAP